MSRQKKDKIFLSEVWIKKAEGKALKKKVCVLVFLSLLVTSLMDT